MAHDHHCRVGRIKIKNGAEVRVLESNYDQVASELRQDVTTATRDHEVAGYALVVWNRQRESLAYWSTGAVMPGDAMPDFVRRVLQRTTGIRDAQDTVNDMMGWDS